MTLLRYGLYAAIGLAVLATWLSSSAGYPIEAALLRGLIAFMAGSFVAYFAELVVMTAPPVARTAALHRPDSEVEAFRLIEATHREETDPLG